MGSDIRTLPLQENGEDDEQDDDDGNEGDSWALSGLVFNFPPFLFMVHGNETKHSPVKANLFG